MRRETRLVRGGTRRSEFDETSEGLFLTSGYVYDSAEEAEASFKGDVQRFMYSRYANPTVSMFEERMALVEGAEACRGTASGMAAVFASLLCQLKAGDRIVASRALFGSCNYIITKLLTRFGVRATQVDGRELDEWRDALSEPATCVFLESPSNPALEIVDIAAVGELAHAAGARVVVDNVFATPVLQRPLELGADVVVYSATKHIDGQGRCLGGAILGTEHYVEEELQPVLRHTGPALSPFNAWVFLKGLETLELRMARHCENALRVAEFLSGHARVRSVRYPGLPSHPQHELAMRQMSGQGGTVIAFEVDGGKAEAFRFLNALELVDLSNNLGDAKSLTTHPATTTHHSLSDEERARLGISPALVRLSVGLEAVEDIVEDLDAALRAM